MQTALVALALTAVGFAAGAFGSAWQTLELRAEPWRKLRVEHQGLDGASTRTRVVFENPELPLQAVELTRSPDGSPTAARVVLQSGEELTAGYQSKLRPSSLQGPDGTRALFAYKGDRARIAFVSPDGKRIGDEVLTVPAALRSPLHLAGRAVSSTRPSAVARLWELLADGLVGEARAQDGGPEKVTVARDVPVALSLRAAGKQPPAPGTVDVVTSCPPFACLPASPTLPMPGESTLFVDVSASIARGELAAPSGPAALEPYEQIAKQERAVAARVLDDVGTVVAAVGITALACQPLDLASPLCVAPLAKRRSTSGAAIHAITTHEVDAGQRIVDDRAQTLYYEEQARAALDEKAQIRICLSRDGYARECTEVTGRPFGKEPMAPVTRTVALRRGIGGTLTGSFEMVQSDGPDCKFSPSPRTGGTLKLSFDDERHTATATLKSSDRGTRPNKSCSLGTANMSWSSSYTATMSQAFTEAQLQSTGKLPLRMTGTMSGTASYSFSNCRTPSGASANCPAGKSDSYTYRVELVGNLDLGTRTGSGRLVVRDAPLSTVGTWRIPAKEQQ